MAASKYIGIRFPFKNSTEGFYFDLTKTSKDEVRSNLTHLLLTKKGSRLYKPEFGTNVQQYIFEQLDDQTFDLIKNEIISAIQANIQGINIEQIDITTQDYSVNLEVKYSYNDGVFLVKDILNVSFPT